MTTWDASLLRARAFAGPSWDTQIVFDGIILKIQIIKTITLLLKCVPYYHEIKLVKAF